MGGRVKWYFFTFQSGQPESNLKIFGASGALVSLILTFKKFPAFGRPTYVGGRLKWYILTFQNRWGGRLKWVADLSG